MKNKIRILCVFLTLALILIEVIPSAGAVSTASPGIVTMDSGYLNIRSSASTGASIVSTLIKGSYITLISKSGSWWKVEYASGLYGYASSAYITQVSGSTETVNIASGSLNVRSGPGTGYSAITTLYNGESIIVLSVSGSWSKILYRGTHVGYVSTRYISSGMTWPVPASHRITQYFSSSHEGIDIGASTPGVAGDTIIAAAGGTVVYSGWLSGYGYVVYVNTVYNNQPLQLRYGHLRSAPLVSAGNTVAKGQALGYMGSTGDSDAAHLHFEVRVRSTDSESLANSASTPVNPLNYVQ